MTKKPSKLKTTKGFWSSLTDEELVRTRFKTAEPENLDGLVLDVPASKAFPFVEMTYDLTGREQKARCAHCRWDNHYHGFVMRTEDGERFLVGIDCGRMIYGAVWESFEKDYNFARVRQGLLLNLGGLDRALPEFIEFLSGFASSPVLTQYFETRRRFRSALPRLYGKLQMAVSRGGGVLSIDETVRDYDAEARDERRYEREMAVFERATVTEQKHLREQGLKPAKPRKPSYTSVPRFLGSVSMPRFFDAQPSLKKDIDAIFAQFEALPLLLKGSKSNHEMVTIVRQVGALLDRISEVIGLLNELADFFHPLRLDLVARWASAKDDIPGRFRPIERGIEVTTGDGEIVAVTLPRDYIVPSIAPIQALRRSIYENSVSGAPPQPGQP